MKEIVTIFQNYCGSGWYPVLFLAALLYLLVTEKKKQIRVVLVESSLVITVLFFLPFTKTVMNLLGEGETYYRILWLLPMAVVIAYGGIRLFGKHYRIGFVILALVLAQVITKYLVQPITRMAEHLDCIEANVPYEELIPLAHTVQSLSLIHI